MKFYIIYLDFISILYTYIDVSKHKIYHHNYSCLEVYIIIIKIS